METRAEIARNLSQDQLENSLLLQRSAAYRTASRRSLARGLAHETSMPRGQSDGSANYLRKDDVAGVEHQPATTRPGLSREEFEQRMARPEAKAAISKMKARHRSIDTARRRPRAQLSKRLLWVNSGVDEGIAIAVSDF
jgi:hypothetical protein